MAKIFALSENALADLDCSSVAMWIAAAADVSLVVDEEGQIVDMAFGSDELARDIDDRWRGRSWMETVTEDSRAKIKELLARPPPRGGTPLWREVNHRLEDGSQLPIRYCVVPLGEEGRVVALGRDLRAVAVLQQQLLNAQQALEQDYWRLRQVETRYRLLFQMAADAVLVIDEATNKVLEANPAASKLLAGAGAKTIIGKTFPMGFDPPGTAAVQALLAETRAVGRGSEVEVRLAAGGDKEFAVSANLIRQDNESRFLVRLSPMAPEAPSGEGEEGRPRLGEIVRQAPDAVLLTDTEGRIRAANVTFLNLAQLASEEQAVGQSVDRWLGRTGVDLNVLLTNLRQHGVVKLFATTLRGEYGTETEVEISATSFAEGDQPLFGLFIRDVGRRVRGETPIARQLPRTVEQLTERVGRVPLRELVRESTDLIEKLCIEAALELTGDNRASAAELLGLSRQSLYAKLRRYKLGDLGADEGD